MTYQPYPYGAPVDPRPPRRKPWRLVLIVVGGVVVVTCGGLLVLGAIVGPPKKTAATQPATQPATAASAAATTHSAAAAVSPTPARSSPPARPSSAPPKAAPPNYAAAAAVLLADDEHYRQEVAAGPPVLGTPAFTAWWKKASTDTQNTDDFKKADAYFTADNEPTDVIEAWRSDNGDAVDDLYQLASAELKAGPGPATAEMAAAVQKFGVDIAKADADARMIQAMH